MKRHRLAAVKLLAAAIMISGLGTALGSCGSTRAYWGVHNDYELSDGSHKRHHKAPKKQKHKKQHKHHHHHDDDD